MKLYLKRKKVEMAVRILFILVLLVSIGCSQNLAVPKGVEWDYDYAEEQPSNIMFELYSSSFVDNPEYVKYDSTQALMLGFNLGNPVMYDNRTWYFFCRAKRLSDSAVSLNSDTISAFFPRILANKPYNFETLKMSIPE